jgi:hypothetical protein
MLANVMVDLRFFMLIFLISTVMFSLTIDILNNDSPEYGAIHTGLANIIDVLRISMGDFEIIERATQETNILFWWILVLAVIYLTIVLLNFIIAEATASYERTTEILQEIIVQDKCSMISEAIVLSPSQLKNELNYPKYIISRKVS